MKKSGACKDEVFRYVVKHMSQLALIKNEKKATTDQQTVAPQQN
jgi:hypothetical protein